VLKKKERSFLDEMATGKGKEAHHLRNRPQWGGGTSQGGENIERREKAAGFIAKKWTGGTGEKTVHVLPPGGVSSHIRHRKNRGGKGTARKTKKKKKTIMQ